LNVVLFQDKELIQTWFNCIYWTIVYTPHTRDTAPAKCYSIIFPDNSIGGTISHAFITQITGW